MAQVPALRCCPARNSYERQGSASDAVRLSPLGCMLGKGCKLHAAPLYARPRMSCHVCLVQLYQLEAFSGRALAYASPSSAQLTRSPNIFFDRCTFIFSNATCALQGQAERHVLTHNGANRRN